MGTPNKMEDKMDLFENEELLKPKKKLKIKLSTIIITIIIILILLCFVIVGLIVYLKGTILTVTVDTINANELKSIFIFEENKIYIPIRKMAEYLQYETYNGDYITLSEETNKCYIENLEELVSFVLDSNIITKVRNENAEKLKIDEPITQINGELCITEEGAEKAFNFRFVFDKERNQITIETLSYLYQLYSQFSTSLGYLNIENEIFENKMLIFNDLIVVKGKNENYGVIDGYGDVVLETKYENIEYLPKTSEFLVSSNNKKGIISQDKTTKINVTYDNIEIITNKNDTFYIIKDSDKYGLLDSNGSVLIYPEYSKIGIDVSQYSHNDVTNGYILHNELIPVSNNSKWALFNVEGKQITDFIYDEIGCVAKKDNTYGVVQIPEYNLIIAKQKDKYDFITLEGKGLFNRFILDSVYISVSSGKLNYYMNYGEKKIELFEFLEKNGVEKATN